MRIKENARLLERQKEQEKCAQEDAQEREELEALALKGSPLHISKPNSIFRKAIIDDFVLKRIENLKQESE